MYRILVQFAHVLTRYLGKVPNPSIAALYEDALVYETGSAITSTGALTAYSGAKTGQSPLGKRVVKEPSSEIDIWWGTVKKPVAPEVREIFSLHNQFLHLQHIPKYYFYHPSLSSPPYHPPTEGYRG
jgi:ATP-dependent phosphoenolpyruvate carboxykinase